MGGEVLAEALAAGRRYIAYLPTATCGHPEHIPSFEALAAVGVVEDAIRLSPQPEAGLDAERLARIEHAARDVDGLWDAKDGKPIRWQVEAGEALEDLRTALRESKP